MRCRRSTALSSKVTQRKHRFSQRRILLSALSTLHSVITTSSPSESVVIRTAASVGAGSIANAVSTSSSFSESSTDSWPRQVQSLWRRLGFSHNGAAPALTSSTEGTSRADSYHSRLCYQQDASQVKSEAVRDFLLCVECEKPRCLFSAKKLTNEQTAQLSAALEGKHYVCGGPLFEHDRPLVSVVGARSDLTCNLDVSPEHFSYERAFPPDCHACGDKNPQPVSQALAQKHHSVHPLCSRCLEKGVKHRTRGKKAVRV